MNLVNRSGQISIAGIPGNFNFIENHRSYMYSQELKNFSTPYKIDQNYFKLVDSQVANQAQSGLAVVQKNLASGNPLQIGVGLVQAPIEGAKTLISGSVIYVSGTISKDLPSGLRATLDNFSDQAVSGIMDSPTAQNIETSVHVVVDTTTTVANTFGTVMMDATNAVTNSANKVAQSAGNFILSF